MIFAAASFRWPPNTWNVVVPCLVWTSPNSCAHCPEGHMEQMRCISRNCCCGASWRITKVSRCWILCRPSTWLWRCSSSWKVRGEETIHFVCYKVCTISHLPLCPRYSDPAFGVTDSLFNCVMNLLVQELTSTSNRMSGLSCSELMSVASALSKAGAAEGRQNDAWSVVMLETSRLLSDPAVDSDASLSTTIVVLNCILAWKVCWESAGLFEEIVESFRPWIWIATE